MDYSKFSKEELIQEIEKLKKEFSEFLDEKNVPVFSGKINKKRDFLLEEDKLLEENELFLKLALQMSEKLLADFLKLRFVMLQADKFREDEKEFRKMYDIYFLHGLGER